MLPYCRQTLFPPGVEAVERAEKSLRTVTCYHPSCREGRRHKDWFKTRIPGQTQQRPQLIQSADDLHRSTSDSSYNVRLDPIFTQIGGPKAHVTLSMTDTLFQQPHRRQARRNKPNEAKRFDIKRIRGKGEKQTQCCYPKSNQYFTGISGPFLKKYE